MILVTGAAGHLGNVLVRQLIARGAEVRALILPGEDTSALDGLPAEKTFGDILDPVTLASAVSGVDTVFHMAALVSLLDEHASILYRVNVEGTRNVIRACQNAGVKRLIYTSSIHALMRPPQGVAIDETLAFDCTNPAGPYDRTKAQASVLVQRAAQEGFSTVILCPTGVIGPYDFRRSEMGAMILEWMRRSIHFLVPGYFDFVDVRDVAQAHICAADGDHKGSTYILSGQKIAVTQMRSIVSRLAGVNGFGLYIPGDTALVLARAAEWYYRITHSRPRFTRYSLETLFSNSDIKCDKARKALGYRPQNIALSLQDTISWWLENRQRGAYCVRI